MIVKIADFGNAISKDREKFLRDKTFDNVHVAPECYKDMPYTEGSDIWAVGVILYKMAFFRRPFKLNDEFMSGRINLEFSSKCKHDTLIDLLTHIFQPLDSRWDIEDCLHSMFIFGDDIPKFLNSSVLTTPAVEGDDDSNYSP